MSMELDENATSEERTAALRRAREIAQEDAARIAYETAIRGGTSKEEAAKTASEVRVML